MSHAAVITAAELLLGACDAQLERHAETVQEADQRVLQEAAGPEPTPDTGASLLALQP